MQYHSTVPSLSRQLTGRSSTGPLAISEPAEASKYDLIGKTVWMRWPADNSFYEAHITDYNPNDVGLNFLLGVSDSGRVYLFKVLRCII